MIQIFDLILDFGKETHPKKQYIIKRQGHEN